VVSTPFGAGKEAGGSHAIRLYHIGKRPWSFPQSWERPGLFACDEKPCFGHGRPYGEQAGRGENGDVRGARNGQQRRTRD